MLDLIKKLREETGAGVMDAKRALEEAGGDFEKARKIIQKSGLAKMAKRSEKEAGASFIESYNHDGKIAVLLELAAETDFVVKTDDFKELAHELALQVAAMNPKDVTELKAQEYIKDPGKKVEDLISAAVAKIGEKIEIKKFIRFEAGE